MDYYQQAVKEAEMAAREAGGCKEVDVERDCVVNRHVAQ